MSNDKSVTDVFRTGKAYTAAQAARLAGTSPATVRRWLLGYAVPGHRMSPVFGSRPAEPKSPLEVSFLELAEIIVVARFRQGSHGQAGVPLERLRRAHGFARQAFNLPYPFASLKLVQFGTHVLREFQEHEPGTGLLAMDLNGQLALPAVVQYQLDLFDFDRDTLARRWFPSGREVPIVVDPHMAAGRPTILGRGITVDTIRNRFNAGENIESITEDFDIDSNTVQAALRFSAA